MAWFKKERKPRTSERIKLEIPPDAWEKCEECDHIDIKEKFLRALNVCPNCGHHRRIPAQEYIDLLVDEGSWHETETKLKSADPLKFENYANRLEASVKKAGPLDAIRTGYARLEGSGIFIPGHPERSDFDFAVEFQPKHVIPAKAGIQYRQLSKQLNLRLHVSRFINNGTGYPPSRV